MSGTAKGGRPRQGPEVKNAPMNMRTSPALRQKIEKAAEASGRSLSAEVETRLETSFMMEQALGGRQSATFANMLALSIANICESSSVEDGKADWTANPETYAAVRAAALRLLDWHRPPLDPAEVQSISKAVERARAATDERDRARDALRDFRLSFGIRLVGDLELPPLSKLQPLLSTGAPTTPEGRETMAAEDLAKEAELIEQLASATTKAEHMERAMQDMLDPLVQRGQEAEARGVQIAEQFFGLYGPKE